MKKMAMIAAIAVVSLLSVSCLSFGPRQPAIHSAIEAGKTDKVKALVEKGANLDEKYYAYTPLEYAAIHGKADIVEYLIPREAEHVPDAVRQAVSREKYDIAKLLLASGSIDINENAGVLYSLFAKKGVPLQERMEKAKEITGGKLNSPYALTALNPDEYQAAVDFFRMDLASRVDGNGRAVLHAASANRNVELVKFLIGKGADVNRLDDGRRTALFYAITSYGASIDWKTPIEEDASQARIRFIGDEPYYSNPTAARQNQMDIVMALLDAKVKVNQQDAFGWTVLHYAAAAYPEGLRELLVSRGADKGIKTNFGRTSDDVLALRK